MHKPRFTDPRAIVFGQQPRSFWAAVLGISSYRALIKLGCVLARKFKQEEKYDN